METEMETETEMARRATEGPRAPIELMGVRVCPWTMEETLAEIARRLDQGKFTQHGVVNAAKVVNMGRDPALRDAVRSCDMINIDGMSLVVAGRLLGHGVPQRVAGIDLFLRLVALAETRGDAVYFLGAEEAVVARAVDALKARHPRLHVAGWHHGYFWDEEEAAVERIHGSGAELLFVAISSPRKEIFINRWRNRLGVAFAMGVGGSFDVVAGKTRRAPVWMQRCGLEWLYRVLQEPRRLWRRYLVTNTLFVWMFLKELWKKIPELWKKI